MLRPALASRRAVGGGDLSSLVLRHFSWSPLRSTVTARGWDGTTGVSAVHGGSSGYHSDGGGVEQNGPDGPVRRTVRQRRIASEVKVAISEALQRGPCANPLFQRCGFQIQDVKMSSDLRTAHVLWTAMPGMQQSAEKAAISTVQRLRSLVFERLNLPFSPRIRFQEDKPSKQMQALDEAFARIKESEKEDEHAQEPRPEPNPSGNPS